jgi:hypothetical protein
LHFATAPIYESGALSKRTRKLLIRGTRRIGILQKSLSPQDDPSET